MTVEIRGTVDAALLDAIVSLQGIVIERSKRWGVVVATVPLSAVPVLAARGDVRRIKLPSQGRPNGS